MKLSGLAEAGKSGFYDGNRFKSDFDLKERAAAFDKKGLLGKIFY